MASLFFGNDTNVDIDRGSAVHYVHRGMVSAPNVFLEKMGGIRGCSNLITCILPPIFSSFTSYMAHHSARRVSVERNLPLNQISFYIIPVFFMSAKTFFGTVVAKRIMSC